MATSAPNVRPSSAQAEAQTPLTILTVEAEKLHRTTNGALHCEVDSYPNGEFLEHQLIVRAHSTLRQCLHVLLTVLHPKKSPYPAEVRAVALLKPGRDLDDSKAFPLARGGDQMQKLVRTALESEEVTALIRSLVAPADERDDARERSTVAPPAVA